MNLHNLHPHARTIADILLATEPGQVVTLDAISAAIGRDVRRCRHHIDRAKKLTQREIGASFATVLRVGYRKLRPEEVPTGIGGPARKRIRGEAGRARTAIIAAASAGNGLPPDAARRANAELGVLGVIKMFAQDRQVKKIAERSEPSATLKPTEAVLRQFGFYAKPRAAVATQP